MFIRTASLVLASILLAAPAFARPPASQVDAKWAERGNCTATGRGIYDRDAVGNITEWRQSGECVQDSKTTVYGMLGFTPSGGSWTYKKYYALGSRTTGPLPEWSKVEPALRHYDLRKIAGGYLDYAWGPIHSLQFSAPPMVNYHDDNKVSFNVNFAYTMNKSRDKTKTMMKMTGNYKITMAREAADADWYMVDFRRLGEQPEGEVTYSDEEFEALRKTMELEEEWKAANPFESAKPEQQPMDKSAAAKGAAAKK